MGITSTPQNPLLGGLSSILERLRSVGDKVQVPSAVPLIGGQGMGHLMMGKTPEEVQNWSYGNGPLRVPEMSNVPQLSSPDRGQSFADALMTIGPSVTGVGRAANAGLNAIRDISTNSASNLSRRSFLQGLGGLAAASAVPGLKHLAPEAVEQSLPEVVEHAAPEIAEHAAPVAGQVISQLARLAPRFRDTFLSAMADDLHDTGSELFASTRIKRFLSQLSEEDAAHLEAVMDKFDKRTARGGESMDDYAGAFGAYLNGEYKPRLSPDQRRVLDELENKSFCPEIMDSYFQDSGIHPDSLSDEELQELLDIQGKADLSGTGSTQGTEDYFSRITANRPKDFDPSNPPKSVDQPFDEWVPAE